MVPVAISCGLEAEARMGVPNARRSNRGTDYAASHTASEVFPEVEAAPWDFPRQTAEEAPHLRTYHGAGLSTTANAAARTRSSNIEDDSGGLRAMEGNAVPEAALHNAAGSRATRNAQIEASKKRVGRANDTRTQVTPSYVHHSVSGTG